jgi:nucleotide-binding universal stress UspA family protein
MYKRIVAGIDGSEISELALAAAISLCRETGSLLQPLFVVFVPALAYGVEVFDLGTVREAFIEEGRRVIARAAQRMKESNVKGKPRLVEVMAFEDLAQEIIASAAEFNADLLVLGTHGRKGFKRLMLGSVAEHTLRLSRIPVLLVPPRLAVPDLASTKPRASDLGLSARLFHDVS